MESTTPVAAPAKATRGSDIDPISSSCRNNSRNSNGGVTAARTTCQKKMPRSPNHSKNSLTKPLEEFTVRETGKARCPGLGERMPPTAAEFTSVTGLGSGLDSDLDSDLALRAHCSSACDEAGSEVRCRKIPGRGFHQRIPAWCSYPSEGRPCRCSGRDTKRTRQSSCRRKGRSTPEEKRHDGHRRHGVLSGSRSSHGAAVRIRPCIHNGSTRCLP